MGDFISKLVLIELLLLFGNEAGRIINLERSVDNFVCPTKWDSPKDFIFPDPQNCKGYIQCSKCGTPERKQCEDSLEWNDNDKICDCPLKSTCPCKATNPPTNPPTNTPTNPPTETPTNPPTETPTNPPTETPTNAPSETPTNTPTNPTSNGFSCYSNTCTNDTCKYRSPNCQTYFLCTRDPTTGIIDRSLQACPKLQFWNDNAKECGDLADSTCGQL